MFSFHNDSGAILPKPLVEDLQEICRQVREGHTPSLAGRTIVQTDH